MPQDPYIDDCSGAVAKPAVLCMGVWDGGYDLVRNCTI